MPPSDQRSGFTLPAVLGVTGVVTLIFLVAITAMASLTSEARAARERVRFLQRALSAEAAVAFTAMTQPVTSRGFAVGAPRIAAAVELDQLAANYSGNGPGNLLWVDGRPYVRDEDANLVLSLQDQAGMINVSRLTEAQTGRFADALGLPPQASQRLWALQNDYTDVDSLKQLNGAEKQDYPDASVANRPLRRANEWLSILTIRDAVQASRWRRIGADVAADSTQSLLNPNTASATALQVLFGASPGQAEAAVRMREQAPFTSIQDFAARTGVVIPPSDESPVTFLSGRIVYVMRDRRSPWVYRARLTLTPSGRERPFWIDQSELTEALRRKPSDITNALRYPTPAS